MRVFVFSWQIQHIGGERAEQGQKNGKQADLVFAPSAFFEMVMQGCHFEDALFRRLVKKHLQYDGYAFDDINDPKGKDQKRVFEGKAQTADERAEKQRAGISHENFCGMKIKAKKSGTDPEQAGGKIGRVRDKGG